MTEYPIHLDDDQLSQLEEQLENADREEEQY
jgi:hypothetical protein